MKKNLLFIGLIILCSLGFTKMWADLNVNGEIYKTDPTYTGQLSIYHSANNQVTFSNSGSGTFMIAGPGNAVDFGTSTLTAQFRGAYFSADVGGSVNALGTGTGNVRLNLVAGRTLIGTNITDDGSTQLQTKGIKATGFNMGATTAGYVLTADASGNYTPQPSAGGGTYGTYTATFTGVNNVTSSTSYGATYIHVGKAVFVSMPFAISATAINTITNMDITLPPGLAAASTTVLNGGNVTTNNGVNGTAGIVTLSTTTTARISFPTPVLNPSGYITFMYTTP